MENLAEIENLVRNKVQVSMKQPKPIKQRIFTWKRKFTSSVSSYLLLLLPYFSCLGSILKRIMGGVNNTIRRFVSNEILRKQLKPRNAIYTRSCNFMVIRFGWRAVMQFLNDTFINLTGLVDLLCGFSLFQVLLSECWNYGMIWSVLLNKIWRVLSNRIQMEELKCGDHIYTWRRAYSYAHHGIYVGNGEVIHFTRGGGLNCIIFSSSPYHHSKSTDPLSSDQSRLDRVICSSINDFLSGGVLYRFEYGVHLAHFVAKIRGGTCTRARSGPPKDVVDRARSFLKEKNGFGKYHFFGNNCEDFAIHCKTGCYLVDNIFSIGMSGQVSSFLVAITALLSFKIRRRTVGITCQHFIVGYSIYSACRWAYDIGSRCNGSKAASSRLAEDESSGYGVSIKFNSAFLKGLALDLLALATWWICCYVLELTTEMTSFQLGWVILTSTICRVLFGPVDPAKIENKNRDSNFHLSINMRIRFISVKTVWLWLPCILSDRAAGV